MSIARELADAVAQLKQRGHYYFREDQLLASIGAPTDWLHDSANYRNWTKMLRRMDIYFVGVNAHYESKHRTCRAHQFKDIAHVQECFPIVGQPRVGFNVEDYNPRNWLLRCKEYRTHRTGVGFQKATEGRAAKYTGSYGWLRNGNPFLGFPHRAGGSAGSSKPSSKTHRPSPKVIMRKGPDRPRTH